jgi:hypothetical protein
MTKDKPCKYLKNISDAGVLEGDDYSDAFGCIDTIKLDGCPKKKIRNKITPHCWRKG